MYILRQPTCLIVNQMTAYSYDFLFNCTTVDQASDPLATLAQSFHSWVSLARPIVAQREFFYSSDYL